MLMLITPWSWDPATEDIQAQTSSRLASAPGWVGAEVVVVDIPDTKAALRASSNKDMVMVESVCFFQRKTQNVRHEIRCLYLYLSKGYIILDRDRYIKVQSQKYLSNLFQTFKQICSCC